MPYDGTFNGNQDNRHQQWPKKAAEPARVEQGVPPNDGMQRTVLTQGIALDQ